MSIEKAIEVLLAKADELRPVPDDDPIKAPLAGIVDEINSLRAIQAKPGYVPEAEKPKK